MSQLYLLHYTERKGRIQDEKKETQPLHPDAKGICLPGSNHGLVQSQELSWRLPDSLETQENRCRKWCAEKGYTLTKVYSDVASGSSLKRTQIQQLFDDAAAGKFDLIVITKMDRFTRSLQDFFTKLRDLQAWDVGIVAIDQPELSTEGPTGKLLRAVILAIAEFERDLIRQRTSEGIRAKIARGEWKGGAPPYGYEIKDGKLQVVEAEAKVVQRIFSEYNNKQSSTEITKTLNSKGIRRRSGAKWTAQSILYIVQNPVYTGKYRDPEDKSQLIEGKHKAIIQLEEFKKALSINTAVQTNRYIHKVMPNEMLFSSILRCGHCMSAMSPYKKKHAGKFHYYYRCQTALKQGAGACPIGQISRIDIEAIGMSLIRMLAVDESLLKSVMDSAGDNQQAKIEILTKEKAEILSRISDLEAKINKWMTNFESSEDPGLVEVITSRISGYKQSIIEMQSTIEEIDRDIVKLRHPVENLEKLTSSYQYFWNRWQGLKFTDRQRIVKTIIKELRLYSESPRHYRLEIDLFGDVNVEIPTSQGGGGGQVRTLFGKSTPGRNRTYASSSGGWRSIH